MSPFSKYDIRWTHYMLYRIEARGFLKDMLEHIIHFSTERYFDTETRRNVIIGKHGVQDVIIPYDKELKTIVPVTVHAITRQQIRYRKLSGRFTNAE